MTSSRDNSATASTSSTTTVNVSPTVATQNRIANVISNTKKVDNIKKKPKQGLKNGTKPKPSTASGLSGYQWNLPPHAWSMPVETADLVNNASGGSKIFTPSEKHYLGATHKYRRGRIYWYARVDNEWMKSKEYNTGIDKGKAKHAKDPRYGFQFMWNPETYQTAVSINMQITPSFADKFVDVVGAFPSGEALSIEIRLDRTNDFACIKSINKSNDYDLKEVAKASAKYYRPELSFDFGFADILESKVADLQKYGTLADLEYLYKAINGPGWTNAANNRKSSDIGFLSPTLLRIDLGPTSYLGYVTNMNVMHTQFTKDMIPIRTDVALQFNLMATAGLAAK